MHAEDGYDVRYLHKRPELLKETAELINIEWPRSLAARYSLLNT